VKYPSLVLITIAKLFVGGLVEPELIAPVNLSWRFEPAGHSVNAALAVHHSLKVKVTKSYVESSIPTALTGCITVPET